MKKGWLGCLKNSILNLLNKPQPNFRLVVDKTSLSGVTNKYVIKETDRYDPLTLLNVVKEVILNKLRENPQTKTCMSVSCTMVKSNHATGEETRNDAHFSSKQETIYEGTDLEDVYKNMENKILESFAKYQNNRSGWRLETINQLELIISKIDTIKTSSYIPLTKKLKAKKAIININNYNQQCFKWCITRAFNPVRSNSERITKISQK